MTSLLRTKSIDKLLAEADEPEHRLRKTLGPWSLTVLGIGAIIGTGIFVLTGTAAAGEVLEVGSILKAPLLDVLLHGRHALGVAGRPGAGPAIALSFFLVAVACAFAGLCYAELASMIPIAGSAYTYAYATMGELVAWIIGWDLILEYSLSSSSVAVGWSGYALALFQEMGVNLPARWTGPPGSEVMLPDGSSVTAIFNVPALAICLLLTGLLIIGIRESARVNTAIVMIKVVVLALFVAVGARYVNTANWHPFIPPNAGEFGAFGWSGILRGAGLIFFAYIGFDAVSTASQEAKDPGRSVPIGILGSLAIC